MFRDVGQTPRPPGVSCPGEARVSSIHQYSRFFMKGACHVDQLDATARCNRRSQRSLE